MISLSIYPFHFIPTTATSVQVCISSSWTVLITPVLQCLSVSFFYLKHTQWPLVFSLFFQKIIFNAVPSSSLNFSNSLLFTILSQNLGIWILSANILNLNIFLYHAICSYKTRLVEFPKYITYFICPTTHQITFIEHIHAFTYIVQHIWMPCSLFPSVYLLPIYHGFSQVVP